MMKVVVVRWHDAHADVSGWSSITGPHDRDPYEIVTVGIALDRKTGRKPGHVSVAQSLSEDQHVDSVLHVPKAMVVDVTELFEIGVTDGKINIDETRRGDRGLLSSTGSRKRSRRGDRTPPSDRPAPEVR
jgi:hypothetical protein